MPRMVYVHESMLRKWEMFKMFHMKSLMFLSLYFNKKLSCQTHLISEYFGRLVASDLLIISSNIIRLWTRIRFDFSFYEDDMGKMVILFLI